jgi:CRP/FNR family cyclic AMP-dependent transcriptional regulator
MRDAQLRPGFRRYDVEGVSCSYPAGVRLCTQGQIMNAVYVLKAGLVKLTECSNNGREQIVAFKAPGSIIGLSAALLAREAESTAITVVHSDVTVLHLSQVREASADPQLACKLLYLQAADTLQMHAATRHRCFGRLRDKLVGLLCWLATEAAVPRDSPERRVPPLTHEELAAAVGASRESVTKLLHVLVQEGALSRTGRWIGLPAAPRADGPIVRNRDVV